MANAPLARQLDRALVRLRTAITEEHLVEPGCLGEQGREAAHGLVVVRGAAVDQALALGGERVQNDARRVAQTVDGPALDEVEIALAVVIPEPRAGALDHDGGGPVGDLHEVLELSDHRGGLLFCVRVRRASAGGAAPRRPAARTSGRVEAALHDGDVVPAAELEGRLPLEADGPKAVARVQVKRCRVLRGDASRDRMVAAGEGPLGKVAGDW